MLIGYKEVLSGKWRLFNPETERHIIKSAFFAAMYSVALIPTVILIKQAKERDASFEAAITALAPTAQLGTLQDVTVDGKTRTVFFFRDDKGCLQAMQPKRDPWRKSKFDTAALSIPTGVCTPR